ncbi:hypothetical protein DYBT9275_02728 [Dyadobacter sp. CECT 9275]|uniref:Uncharacterized protein n=1 Tax=Dyadobacter helix TaxID=2822344 RepID=A0A916JCQ5_9BACT|nr:hypothetical protein [Dyadobacter sp. CECT 9275]CAG5001719.1 hypothetical protein DYBT9275_02728 [Dyadobacter sp. CECT 9275]
MKITYKSIRDLNQDKFYAKSVSSSHVSYSAYYKEANFSGIWVSINKILGTVFISSVPDYETEAEIITEDEFIEFYEQAKKSIEKNLPVYAY